MRPRHPIDLGKFAWAQLSDSCQIWQTKQINKDKWPHPARAAQGIAKNLVESFMTSSTPSARSLMLTAVSGRRPQLDSLGDWEEGEGRHVRPQSGHWHAHVQGSWSPTTC